MTATNGWPGKPGVPLNPTEDEPHWLSWRDEKPRAVEWDSQSLAPVEDEDKQGFWRFGDLYGTPEQVAADGWRYLGPVASHEKVAALQKRVAELEDFCEDYLVRFELFHITNTQDAPEDATGFLAEKARAILGAALTGGKDE